MGACLQKKSKRGRNELALLRKIPESYQESAPSEYKNSILFENVAGFGRSVDPLF